MDSTLFDGDAVSYKGYEGKRKVTQPTKTPETENFPVASLLLAKKVRHQVLAFYRLARAWDDIADAPVLSAEEKLSQLDQHKPENRFLADLLIAFKQDATKHRYQTWDDLLEYCRFSANPVGRFLLDIHGEPQGHKESDALCTALQILNHLQDCAKDFKEIDRIYLPTEMLPEELEYEDLLLKNACEPALREVLDISLAKTDNLINEAKGLASQIQNKRLRYQAKVTWLCAAALSGKLKRQDPLARRVELTKLDKLLIAYRGLYPL